MSPMDIESRNRWVEYSKAKDTMFAKTHIPEAPWFTVEADDKRRARLNCLRHILSKVPYEDMKPHPSRCRSDQSKEATNGLLSTSNSLYPTTIPTKTDKAREKKRKDKKSN